MDLWLQRGSEAAQILIFIVLAFALVFARRQAREQEHYRLLRGITIAISELGDAEIRSLRSWVLNEMPDNTNQDPKSPEFHKACRLAVAYDRVCFLALVGAIPGEKLLEFHEEFRPLWDKLWPVIETVRKQPARKRYCNRFEAFVRNNRAGHAV